MLDFDNFYANLQARTGNMSRVVAQLHDVQELTPELAKVLVSFNTNEGSQEENFYAIASVFDGLAAPIEGTFRRLSNVNHAYAAVGFITRNTETRSVTTANLQKYRVMAGNLLIDEDDQSLWELKGDKNSRYLARQSDESLAELVQHAGLSAKSLSGGVNLANLVQDISSKGEFVTYVSPKTLEFASGILLNRSEAGMEVFDVLNDTTEIVSLANLIETVHVDWSSRAKEHGEALPPANRNTNKQDEKEFYSKVYSYDPTYLEMIYNMVDEEAVA